MAAPGVRFSAGGTDYAAQHLVVSCKPIGEVPCFHQGKTRQGELVSCSCGRSSQMPTWVNLDARTSMTRGAGRERTSVGPGGTRDVRVPEVNDKLVISWDTVSQVQLCPIQDTGTQRPESLSGPGRFAYDHYGECPMAPDDPIGTVRATDGILALRAPASSIRPDMDGDDELSWFIIDIGRAKDLFDMDFEEIEDRIATWPIVYQPR